MIKPTKSDIGRRVMYMGYPRAELGTIKSFNERFVFVLYDGDLQAKATYPEDLNFTDGKEQD